MTDRNDDAREGEVSLAFPLETLKRSYITRFGGRSADLDFDQIGINGMALAKNTDLNPGETVTVGILGVGRTRPFMLEPLYVVTALDSSTPDALMKSCTGEAVFSSDIEAAGRRTDLFKRGELVVISGILGKTTKAGSWRWDILDEVLHELKVIQD